MTGKTEPTAGQILALLASGWEVIESDGTTITIQGGWDDTAFDGQNEIVVNTADYLEREKIASDAQDRPRR